MLSDLIPKLLWNAKIRVKQKRLGNLNSDSNLKLSTLDDYLIASNKAALEYFEQNSNPLKKLWEYFGIDPKCGHHSTYTYAAFLSLTEEHSRTELQEDVRWVAGLCRNLEKNNAMDYHVWLEKRVGGDWKVFETIPDMQKNALDYETWYTLKIFEGKFKKTSEHFLCLPLLYHSLLFGKS